MGYHGSNLTTGVESSDTASIMLTSSTTQSPDHLSTPKTGIVRLVFVTAMMASNFFLSISAQIQPGPPQRLWEAAAPGALGDADQDIPTITPYLVPEDQRAASHAGVIIFPGGGYGGLAGHEGQDYAQWFNQQGISAFVIKYRLGTHGYRHPVMLQDAARAVRFVRHHATTFHVNASRIGIIGSSAGGHLSSTLLTHFDNGSPDSEDPLEKLSSRPDFGILCYPVITMGPETHQGSKNNLLGKDPDPSLVWYLSNEKQVSPQTPPCFLWHTAEDKAVLVQNSIAFASALAAANVPFDLHIYQKGRHGIGLQAKFPFENPHPWATDLRFWLKENGWL